MEGRNRNIDGLKGFLIVMVILGHVHEDHTVALDLLTHAGLMAHELDVQAVRSWDGLKRHYGYAEDTLGHVREMIERDFHYAPRPDAMPYVDGQCWQLGGGVSIRRSCQPTTPWRTESHARAECERNGGGAGVV